MTKLMDPEILSPRPDNSHNILKIMIIILVIIIMIMVMIIITIVIVAIITTIK